MYPLDKGANRVGRVSRMGGCRGGKEEAIIDGAFANQAV